MKYYRNKTHGDVHQVADTTDWGEDWEEVKPWRFSRKLNAFYAAVFFLAFIVTIFMCAFGGAVSEVLR